MTTLPNMLRTRGVALGALALLLGVAACAEQQPSGSLGDLDSPGLTLAPLDAPNDSSIAFTATAVDNLGIKSIRILISGGITGVLDTNFTVNQTRITVPYTLSIPTTVQPGTAIILIGTATDGARNVSAPDTLTLTVGGVAPPTVRIVSPTAADAAVVGRQLLITITGSSELKVRSLGYIATGAVTGVDSVVYGNPLLIDRTAIDTLTIPAGATPGPLTLQPFLVDSLGRQRFLGAPVTLQVIPAAGAGTRPVVDFGLNDRVEITDTIFVTATDPAGISMLGYDVRLLDGTPSGPGFHYLERTDHVAPQHVLDAIERDDVPDAGHRQGVGAELGGYVGLGASRWTDWPDQSRYRHRRGRQHAAAPGRRVRRRRAVSPGERQALSLEPFAESARGLLPRRLHVQSTRACRIASVGYRGVAT